MIRLKDFYSLLHRIAEVTLKDHAGTKILFDGKLQDIPDEYDDYAVDEFQVRPCDSVLFRIMRVPDRF